MIPWMINCKKYSELVSKGLDRPLSFGEWVSVKMHRLICPACQNVKKQLVALGQACRFAPKDEECDQDPSCALPEDACASIKVALKKKLPEDSGH